MAAPELTTRAHLTSIEPHLQRRIATLALALVAATCIGLAALLGQQRREAFLVNQGAELGKHL